MLIKARESLIAFLERSSAATKLRICENKKLLTEPQARPKRKIIFTIAICRFTFNPITAIKYYSSLLRYALTPALAPRLSILIGVKSSKPENLYVN
jgi:hypothetical protein